MARSPHNLIIVIGILSQFSSTSGLMERLHKRTINMTSETWTTLIVQKRNTETIFVCAAACLYQASICNAFHYLKDTGDCELGKLNYLEDPNISGPKFEILVDVDLIETIPQHCKGGAHCCHPRKDGNLEILCGHGEGDCNSKEDCRPGLNCNPGACSTVFGYSGGLWDSGDDCCENNCTVEHPCATGEGNCFTKSDCLNSSWSDCVTCKDLSLFPTSDYPFLWAEGHLAEDKCCKRWCLPSVPCTYNMAGCNTDEDCITGYTCTMVSGTPRCMDIDECTEDPDICGSGYYCTNVIGSYRCLPGDPMALVVLGGRNSAGNPIYSAEAYNLTFGECANTNIPNFPRMFSQGAAVYINGKIIACGGNYIPDHCCMSQSTCYALDESVNNPQWQQIAGMSERRRSFVMVAHNGLAYAFGGFFDNGIINRGITNVERYNPSSNNWSRMINYGEPSYPAQPYEFCGASDYPDTDNIYVAGGYDRANSDKRMSQWFRFSVSENYFYRMPDLFYGGVAGLSCTIVRRLYDGHRLMVFYGGSFDSNPNYSGFFYNLYTGQYWYYLESPNGKAGWFAQMASLNKYMFFMFTENRKDLYYSWIDNSITFNQKPTPQWRPTGLNTGYREVLSNSQYKISYRYQASTLAIPASSPLLSGCF